MSQIINPDEIIIRTIDENKLIIKNETFWLNDISELFKNKNYLKFFPRYGSTRDEQLNAFTRFFIYFIVLILLFDINQNWLYLPIVGIVIIVFIYYLKLLDVDSGKKELERILKIRSHDKQVDKKELDEQLKHDGEQDIKLETDDSYEYRSLDSKIIKHGDNTSYKGVDHIEAGFIDANGKLNIGRKYGVDVDETIDNLYSIREMEDYSANTCRRPTVENPFMNPTILDYNNGIVPVACNADESDINNDMTVFFNHELFRDVDELWERANSQRQFYTIPNTAVPNNQTEFAKWLYAGVPSCKQNQEQCLRWEDLRHIR